MEHLPEIVIDLALILAIAGITTLICKKLKQPLVLGYVVAGFLISPAIGFIPNIIDMGDVGTWSEIGVIFLMFGLGLEFSVVKLTSVGRPAVITALIEMSLMILAGFLCGTLLGWSFWTCVFLGGMLAISSTTIIIKSFDELGLRGKRFSELVFGSLIVEDIVGIFLMVILSTVAVGSSIDGGLVLVQLGTMILYLIIWFVLSMIIIPTFLRKVSKGLTDEIILIVSIALCLGMVILANAIGFSAALGAFIAGSILAGTVQAHRIEKLFKPIKDLFGAIFFVSVGMLVSPQSIADNWFGILIVTLVTLIGKPIFSSLGAFASGQSLRTSVQVGLSLSQIGEFSFIIAALGVSLGVTASFLYPVIVSVSVITTLTTPLYIKSTDRVYKLLITILPDSLIERIDTRAQSTEDPKESSLWINYLKYWFIKIFMVVIAALASVEIFRELLRPFFITVFSATIIDHIFTVLSLVITGLFIANLFQATRKGDFGKLWIGRRRHHAPLIATVFMSFLTSIIMIVYIVLAFEDVSPWWILPAIIITFLLVRSRHLHSWFLELETRFVRNLNERLLEERTTDHNIEERLQWAEDHLFVTEVSVTKSVKRRGKSIPLAHFFAQTCNLDLLAIRREGVSLYENELAHLTKDELRTGLADPENRLMIKKKDVLTYVGTEDEIEAFLNNMVKADALAEDDVWKESLRQYLPDNPAYDDLLCFSLKIDSSSEFRGKTITAINYRENYGCLVIGLERNLLPIIKPSRNTRLAQGDLVLLLGKREIAEFFISAAHENLITPMHLVDSSEEDLQDQSSQV